MELAWNPEFLREGHAIEDTLHPSRLVFGVASERARRLLEDSFRPLVEAGVPTVVTDLATAELVKVAANSFLATKISFINAMAEVCETTGADVSDLASALAYDDRIGGRFLKPGLGFGGGCLPKDIRAFIHRAEELGTGQSVSFLREVDAINQRRRGRTVDLVREQAGGDLRGVRVCVLGAAFKPHSDDTRDAPALDVAAQLHEAGAHVVVFDPQAIENARRSHPQLEFAGTALEAADGAQVVALLTEWDQFRGIDPRVLGRVVGDEGRRGRPERARRTHLAGRGLELPGARARGRRLTLRTSHAAGGHRRGRARLPHRSGDPARHVWTSAVGGSGWSFVRDERQEGRPRPAGAVPRLLDVPGPARLRRVCQGAVLRFVGRTHGRVPRPDPVLR